MKKIFTVVILIFFGVCFVPILLSGDTPPQFEKDLEYNDYLMMPESLVYWIQQGKRGFVVYDIRSRECYAQAHLQDSVNYPWDPMDDTKGNPQSFQAHVKNFPKNMDIVIMSNDGEEGFKAIELLLKNGYKSVYTIEGGINNWPYRNLLVP